MTNTEIVRSMYEAFGRGDIAAVLNNLADGVEWITPGSKAIPYAGIYRGREGAVKFFQKLAETTELDPFTPDRYIEQGGVVVALGSYTGRSKAQQKLFRSSWAMVFTLLDGKVTRFEEHMDTEALAGAFAPASQAARS